MRVLDRIPESRLSWRPHPKSMTLGQLVFHIATTPGGVAQIAALDTMEKPQFDRPQPTGEREGAGGSGAVGRVGQGVPAWAGRRPSDPDLDHDLQGQAVVLGATKYGPTADEDPFAEAEAQQTAGAQSR